ncbi:RHS repeat domain-containing protein [Massilia sp. CT11-137]|uniref:RHS repeat domain-containing protein n=1 Tax=Massilia sp. CT11-137 TaxID=3393901 RepID=UPI0039B066C2
MQTTLPDGRILNNLYYGSGHLHQVNLDGEVITDIERDRAHRMVARTQGALVSQFRYDPVGRLLSQTVGEVASTIIARKYDEVGNLVSIDDRRNGVTRYSYDPIGRILSAVQPQSSERFAFDPAHNLLDATVAPVGRVEGNRIRVYEDKRYDYDGHGNVVEKLVGKHTRMRFEWNPGHQLVRSVVARGPTDSAQTVSYAYDPFGRRISKRDAFGVTRFVWDGNRLLCEERGSHARTYVYGEDAFVPLARLDSVAGADGAEPAEMRHLHTDHLGTPRELTDADGRVVWAARYRAWGNVLEVVREEVPVVVLPDEIGEVQPVRFQGQYHDNESGLHYNRFRYYDPDIGRFVSIDPIGLAGGTNGYGYASNPVGWVDPAGLSPCKNGNTEGANKIATPASWGLTLSETKTVLSSAQVPYKGSTIVGHALAKHSGRPVTFSNPSVSGAEVWGKIKGKMTTWNEQGKFHLKDIIRAPGDFSPIADGNLVFLEKRLPDGRGVRLNQDKTFKEFID